MSNKCERCSREFGVYFCGLCRMWEDKNLNIYHCDKCGLCRRGQGLDIDFFHCDQCNCCMPISSRGKHVCRSQALNQDCPVCLENLMTSIRPSILAPLCGHAMHHDCYQQFLQHGNIACPTCQQPLIDLNHSLAQMSERGRGYWLLAKSISCCITLLKVVKYATANLPQNSWLGIPVLISAGVSYYWFK